MTIETWIHLLSRQETLEQLERLGQRMKVDLELNETFRGMETELRDEYERRQDELTNQP